MGLRGAVGIHAAEIARYAAAVVGSRNTRTLLVIWSDPGCFRARRYAGVRRWLGRAALAHDDSQRTRPSCPRFDVILLGLVTPVLVVAGGSRASFTPLARTARWHLSVGVIDS